MCELCVAEERCLEKSNRRLSFGEKCRFSSTSLQQILQIVIDHELRRFDHSQYFVDASYALAFSLPASLISLHSVVALPDLEAPTAFDIAIAT